MSRIRIARSCLVLLLGANAMIGCSGGSSIPATQSAVNSSQKTAPSNGASASPAQSSSDALVAYPADSFVDSIGLNTSVPNLYMRSDYATLVSKVQQLGVRHIRDAILNHDPQYDGPLVQMLSAANATLDGLSDCAGLNPDAQSATSAADIVAFNAAIGSRIESVEAPNEVDDRDDPNFVADTLSCLPIVRSALPVPFIAPSLTDPLTDAPKLGDLSSEVDYGNIHRYYNGHNPGSPPYGASANSCGGFGSLQWFICESRVNCGSKPIEMTETGYNTDNEVDEPTQAKYLSRALLYNFQAGIKRSFVYSLTSYTGGDGFGGDGLLRTDDSPKPAYTAIANEIASLSDPGPTFSPQPAVFTLGGSLTSNVLFAKRDGSYRLALWLEVPSWNPVSDTEISVAPVTVTVNFAAAPSAFSAQALDDSGNLDGKAVMSSGTSYSMAVDDHVTLVSFRP